MELNTQVGGMSLLLFGALKMGGMLRVSQEIEEIGMDLSKHGGNAYEKETAPSIKAVDLARAEIRLAEHSRLARAEINADGN